LEYRVAFPAKTPWRVVLVRAFAALLVAFAVSVPTIAPAQAIENLRKYAGIVVDAKSGQVMYEEQGDSKRYPASVAKVMTLYVLFQELSAGNLKLSTKMTVSKHAASAVPTKLGLRAGSTITVEDAIKSLVTLSANDMARVIAEHISGSETKFAERMTATARALGMRNTTYRNASGLPDGGQLTTVRDQAIPPSPSTSTSRPITNSSRPARSATARTPMATTTGCWAIWARWTASRPASSMRRVPT
jgi:D-alanyl-D-alanine carboxypeptidase